MADYKPIELIYADLIQAGKKKIEDVPATNRVNVITILVERGEKISV